MRAGGHGSDKPDRTRAAVRGVVSDADQYAYGEDCRTEEGKLGGVSRRPGEGESMREGSVGVSV